MNEKCTERLSENVAMLCLDKQYDKIDNHALYVLTDLMREYALEIGTEIKKNAELSNRHQPNLIDALVVAREYGDKKEFQIEFIENKEFSFLPYK